MSRKAQPDFAMGLPSFVQKPRSLSRLSSLGRGAFITVSHPVERRLNFLPHILVCRVSLASAPAPNFSLVPRKRASSVRAWVMCVFSSTPGKLKLITQEGFDFLFHLFSERMASPYSDDPIIRISQVFDPDETRVIYLESWKRSHLLTDALKLPCLGFSAFDHAALLPGEPLIGEVAHLPFALFVLCSKPFNKIVEFVKVNIG